MPFGSSISLTVRQMGKVIYSVFFLGGSSSVFVVLATILMSGGAKPLTTLCSLFKSWRVNFVDFPVEKEIILNKIGRRRDQIQRSSF